MYENDGGVSPAAASIASFNLTLELMLFLTNTGVMNHDQMVQIVAAAKHRSENVDGSGNDEAARLLDSLSKRFGQIRPS